jgi:hydroxymethylbilane synthase
MDGEKMVKGAKEGRAQEAEKIGEQLADELLSRGATEILGGVYR